MRILFALPGFHRFDRGAEVALISVAKELTQLGHVVTLIGSGAKGDHTPYNYVQGWCLSREYFERFPRMPLFRNETSYEELTFVPSLLLRSHPSEYDLTVTCSYPFTNWALRSMRVTSRRPKHVFVTENGDWPAYSTHSEYRFFNCDGLVCTNPDFYERNCERWRCILIPNGVDCTRFKPGDVERARFDLPTDRPIVLMVSALISSKRVSAGIKAVSQLADSHLVVAGRGPLRSEIERLAAKQLPNRFTLTSVPSELMPSLYRSADVFLHLSKEEAFGNVFVEAMACGVPIVAHDSARVRWIVGDEQFLTDSEKISNVADAIKTAMMQGPSRRNLYVKRAQAFAWPQIGARYEQFFQELMRC